MPAGSEPSLSKLGEFGLIRYLQRRFGDTGSTVVQGMGDDAAIIRPVVRRQLLVTTDLLAEGVHFHSHSVDPKDIGYKAAVANLSDIAAMGGMPHYVLVSIAVPPSHTKRDIERLYEGIMTACRRHHVELIGGDTSASKQGLFVSITLLGSVTPRHALSRDGARRGDLVYVTGTLGDSLAGLQLLTHSPRHLRPAHRRYLLGRHARPTPRLKTGQLLSGLRLATAAIDVSDGLGGDLSRLCEQSGVGAVLESEQIPCSVALKAYSTITGQDPTRLALRGGEDYELLFTIRPRDVTRLNRLGRRLDCPLIYIGVIQSKREGLQIRRQGIPAPLRIESYEHFQTDGQGPKPSRPPRIR